MIPFYISFAGISKTAPAAAGFVLVQMFQPVK